MRTKTEQTGIGEVSLLQVLALARRIGVDLNLIFDPLWTIRLAVLRRACPERPAEVEQSHHEE